MIDDLKTTVRAISVVANQQLVICKIKYTLFHCCVSIVTEKGLHCLDLAATIWGYNPTISLAPLLIKGEFSGLAILHPDSDFPLVLITTKKRGWAFLEQRG